MASGEIRRATAKEIQELLRSASYDEVEGLAARFADDGRAQVQKAVEAALRRHEREKGERERVQGMYELEWELSHGGVALGVDEVGRGAVAGPLTVCAVALPKEPMVWGINDSKQLTPARREELAARIAEVALAVGIAHIEPASIDAVGMAVALRMGMSQAIENAGIEPDAVLIDGNPVHVHPLEQTIVKGDAHVACIAAASILAKVARDALMVGLSRDYPEYGWDSCKGYGSAEHIAAIRAHGLTPHHRSTFCEHFVERPSLF